MSFNPFFSIIIPTYNRGYIIEKAIKSVLNQSYNNWEMIIIDDGSTDNTEKVVQKYLFDKRISYFKFEENKGVNVARNFAISRTKGIYILNLDSDNQFLEDSLKLIHDVIEQKHHSLVFFRVKTVSGKRIYKPIEGFVDYKSYLCEKIRGEYYPVVKRNLIVKFPFEEEIIGGEAITWKKIVKYLGKVYFYPYEVLLYNDILGDRLSIKRRNFKRLAKVFRHDLKVFGKKYLKYCPKLFIEKLTKYLLYSIISLK